MTVPVRPIPNLLSIAGTDPTGGAGVQADLKSFAAFETYGMCVITALVAQNTQGVRQIHVPDLQFLRAQLESVSEDVAMDAVKTGMLGTGGIIRTIADWWDGLVRQPTLVVDPVMVATSGDRLLETEAEEELIGFLHRADLITPNVPELALLAGEEPASERAVLTNQARRVADAHGVTVLAKGGHLSTESAEVEDVLVSPVDDAGRRPPEQRFGSPRIATRNTHGTGCSVSAALAALSARGWNWEEAVPTVKEWMTAALRGSEVLEVGRGHGPVHHFAQMWR